MWLNKICLKCHSSILIDECLLWWYACSTLSTLAHRKPTSADFPPYPSQQPILYGVHTELAGRHACAFQHWSSKSVSQPARQLALWALSHPILSCPVLSWPCNSCRTPEDDQVEFYTASMRKAELMLTAALTTVLLFIFIASPSWTTYKCSVSFSELWSLAAVLLKWFPCMLDLNPSTKPVSAILGRCWG